ncbi:hypothetical protein [Larkinella soli]|uniref:hypothetical protein n=1 Tax=Larkinella soli TaxID=1770527 RepID=UPI000FFB7CBA|nr:hypothetical protein [Larkinella soli]
MSPSSVFSPERTLQGLSMLIAPLLFTISSFFISPGPYGEYGTTGGTLIVLGSVFWIPAFMGLFDRVRTALPRYAAWGLLIAVYGCIAGSNFGLRGVYAEAFGLSHARVLEESAAHPLSFNLTLYWGGPLFPLSLLVLGIQLIRTRTAPIWVGVLICLEGVLFPLSRIGRHPVLAHLSDLMILIPMVYLGFHSLLLSSSPKTNPGNE